VPFQKGQSGNPKGRPKKGTAMADALRTVLNKSKDGKQNKRALAEKVVEMALSGNTEAIKLVFDRMDGKVPQTNVLQGSDEAPPIRYVRVGD
jgi:phage I-like protein